MRGVAEMSRGPSRHPFPPYYPGKLPDGLQYGAMPSGPRPPHPYSGKPGMMPGQDGMYGPGWGSMMPQQAYPGLQHHKVHPYPSQADMYMRQAYQEPMPGPGGYFPPSYGQSFSGYPYPPMPLPHRGGGPNMDGFPDRQATINYPPQNSQNDIWRGSTAASGPPGAGSQDALAAPTTRTASPHTDLQKQSSVSSLKDALLANTSALSRPNFNDSHKYSYLNVESPITPQAKITRTPDPSTPKGAGIVGVVSPGINTLTDSSSDAKGSTNHIEAQANQFEVEAILGLNDAPLDPSNGGPKHNEKAKSPEAPAVNNNSTLSSPSTPRNRKVRTPIMSPVERTHASLMNQYSLGDEPGRKELLDALLNYLEREGVPILRIPVICKGQLDIYKTFTAVQQLGGFTHVVDKRLWKEVLHSFNTSSINPSSASLRTLQEYYVKMLLPYECHLTNTSYKDCIDHYDNRVSTDNGDAAATAATTVPNSHSTNAANNKPLPDRTNSTGSDNFQEPSDTCIQDLLSNPSNAQESLLGFSEDSQNSTIENISSQPLPDISVQEAESVLGIPSTTSRSGDTPSFPQYQQASQEWSDYPPSMEGSGGMGSYPQPMGPGYSSSFPPFAPSYQDYQRRMHMGGYMGRGYPGMGMPASGSHDPYGYNHLPRPRMDDMGYAHGGPADWQWSRPPRIPPPLPAHLQSGMFQPGRTPPPPSVSSSPRPSTPQLNVSTEQSSPRPTTSSSLEPIRIQWQEQMSLSDKPPMKRSEQDTVDKGAESVAKPPTTSEITTSTSSSQVATTAGMKRSISHPTVVEQTQPQLVKRKRLNCDHCGHVEPWRVMMSLKSSVPADSTWALDTLSILLHDDRTVGFFYLKHHHSLLNTLVNHFNKSLYMIFGKPFKAVRDYQEESIVPNGTDTGGPPSHSVPVPVAEVYSMTKEDVRSGHTDTQAHYMSSCLECPPDDLAGTHPMMAQPPGASVDKTPITELIRRDTLSERILLHLKTPRRLMARSPMQKYFFPSDIELTIPSSPDNKLYEENEVYQEEILPLWTTDDRCEKLQQHCLTISNILRSLSFIPGNDYEFCQHAGLLIILGHLLMLHHVHYVHERRDRPQEEGDDLVTPKVQRDFWWWDCLQSLRENTFVILANISGQLDLSLYPEAVARPIVDGLLHWLVCPSSQACDPLPDFALVFSLSPQRLVIEALAKMSISEVNVDHILATPPLPRLDLVYSALFQLISQKKHPAVRQFSLVLLSNMAQGGEGASRMISQQKMCIPLLLECLESSEQYIISKNRMPSRYNNPEDPNALSLAMLRRTAITLHCLAKVPINRVSFLPYTNRLLSLSMSEVLDPSLTSIISDVLFELTRYLK